MRGVWDGTIEGAGAAGSGAEAIDGDALGLLAADDDLLHRLFDFTLEHGPTLMDFDGSFGVGANRAEARAGRW